MPEGTAEEDWWKEVDKALMQIRKNKSATQILQCVNPTPKNLSLVLIVVIRQLNHIYKKDVSKYGDPANSGLTHSPIMAHQAVVDKWAGAVRVPVDSEINGNGKRRRIEGDQGSAPVGSGGA